MLGIGLNENTSDQVDDRSLLSTVQIKYIRHIVQFQVVILILYSITNPSSPIKLIWKLDPITSLNTFLTGTRVPLLSHLPALIMITAAAFFGRVFCGWICPMGLIQDLTSFGNKRKWFPEWFRLIKYAILLGGLILPAFSGWTFLEWFTPLPLFTQVLVPFRLGISGTHAGVITFILSILFSTVSEKRAWCRYICPLGAVLSLSSIFKYLRMRVEKDKCINCLKCDKHCSMGVMDVENQSGLRWDTECILCINCRDLCPTNAIRVSKRMYRTRF